MRRSLLALMCVCFVALAGLSQADVIDSEDFESFSDGFLIVDDADWEVHVDYELEVKVIDSSLSYSRGAVSVDGGNRALEIGEFLPSATTNNFTDWFFEEVAADDKSDVWFSYLLQTSETASTAIPDFAEDRDFFQLHLSADGAEGQSVSMVLDNASPAVPGLDADHIFRARSGSSGNVTDTGQLVRNTPTETQFIVGHIETVNGEYETMSIYANPGSPAPPTTPTAMATFGGMDATTLAQFTVRISGLEDEDIYWIDEITIGDSYEDVAPIDPNFLLGDFDGNGTVDLGDFQVLADNLFDGTTYQEGDIDFSGATDLNDFLGFRGVFGADQADVAAVPEPCGMILLCLASCLLPLVRRRRR